MPFYKEYYLANRDKILTHAKEKERCDICDKEYIRAGRSKHMKSMKHLINSNPGLKEQYEDHKKQQNDLIEHKNDRNKQKLDYEQKIKDLRKEIKDLIQKRDNAELLVIREPII